MNYAERVAEYEFTTRNHADATIYNFLLLPNIKAKLRIKSREYLPQKRTVKILDKYAGHPVQYLSFPTMRFSEFIIEFNNGFIHFYQVLAKTNFVGILKVLSVTKSGVVCLGSRTHDRYVNLGLPKLTMDEFVEAFWMTKFLGPFEHKQGVLTVTDSIRIFPDVWSDAPIDNVISNEFIKI